ncbi:MAG TPA: hypothetical protein VLZ83_15745 [Edaphocola sp.]|nr:hypothetical protein [Edaphocola sp.]
MKEYDSIRTNGRSIPYQSIAKGAIFILVGIAFLLRQIPATEHFLPEWLFGIHSLLILIGLYKGIQTGFNGVGWMILIIIGVLVALRNYNIMNLNTIFAYGVPFGLIVIGLFIITKRN